MSAANTASAGAAATPHLPTLQEVFCQAYRDLFGKDVQENPTVSYVWTADQFGHFGLGFQITFALTWILSLCGLNGLDWKLGAGAVNLAIWITKEVSDYFREKRLADAAASIFAFNARELCWNIVTALFYIATGIIVATFSFWGPGWALVTCFVLLLPALGIGVWWLRRKIVFQQTGLPYLYRLANFPPNVTPDDAKRVAAIIDPATIPMCRHLLLSGPIGAGKTSLASGIGTEFAFRMGVGRYTTLVKLLQSNEQAPQGGATEFDDGRILWPWQTAPLLVIDDVDDAGDMAANLTSAALVSRPPIDQVEHALASLLPPAVKDGLVARRTVWVIGDFDPAPWIAMLQRVFRFTDTEIAAVTLTETVRHAVARKRAAHAQLSA